MKERLHRLMHQVVSDEKGRPRIVYIVIRRAGGTQVAGPYGDWRMAQAAADRLDASAEAAAEALPAADPLAAAVGASG